MIIVEYMDLRDDMPIIKNKGLQNLKMRSIPKTVIECYIRVNISTNVILLMESIWKSTRTLSIYNNILFTGKHIE